MIYTEWIFFGLMALGLLRLRARRRRDGKTLPPPLARGTLPWMPIGFAVCAFGIVINQVAAEPANSAWGLGLVAAGVPVYFIARGRRR